MDMELGMELVLDTNLPLCECNNCFMGSFLQMMRYKGVRLSELEVQLPYAGVRLSLSYQEGISLSANFIQGIHYFCSENQIAYKTGEILPQHIGEVAYEILSEHGAFMISLNSRDYGYYKAFVNDGIQHCTLVTGVDREGLHIVDVCASTSQPTTHKGVLPFGNILEIGQHQPIPIAYIEGEVAWDKKEKGIDWVQARKNHMEENIKLEQGSRLRTGLDYCQYLYSDLPSLRGFELRKIAHNIMTDTHVPQLKMLINLFADKKQQEYYIKMNQLCNDWTLMSYRFLKGSFEYDFADQETLVYNYKALLEREREIYQL